MIDIEMAKRAFAEYIKKYDYKNSKIALKIKHIYRVADISKDIAIKNNFNEEDQKLAELIGLLHDIGRFEQIRIYNTFLDHKSINHAEMGIKVLFEDGLIRKFVKEDCYDEIIKTSILNHNKSRISSDINGKKLEFCKIIRDADKVDIFGILISDNFEDTHGKADLSNDLISEEIFREFKFDRIIDYKKMESAADKMVAHIAYVFDFNYDYCLKKIRDERYIEQLVEKACYKNDDTIRKMEEIVKIANEYIDNKLHVA